MMQSVLGRTDSTDVWTITVFLHDHIARVTEQRLREESHFPLRRSHRRITSNAWDSRFEIDCSVSRDLS